MIKVKDLKLLLEYLDIGASTAEKDPLLESAQIRTQEFHDLYLHDRIDIVRGIKGSGKTALYRVFFFLRDYLVEEDKLYCIFGINATGDPIFRLFQKDFEQYNEIEFENFWSVYFISLVHNLVHTTEGIKNSFSNQEREQIDIMLAAMGLKLRKGKFSLKDMIYSILEGFKRCKKMALATETKFNSNMPQVISVKPSIEFEFDLLKDIAERPVYIAEFRDYLVSLLKQNKFKIWLMLDRLDEVFPRRSNIERNGLKGLLKAAYNFSNPYLRVKVFLRDDIIDYLAADGFTAFTHVTDRCSSTMTWSKDGILHLIVKRIFAKKYLTYYYSVDSGKIDEDQDYREEVFYRVFPKTIGRTPTLNWLYAKCADSNGIVTPRDIIDFFRIAKSQQYRVFKLNPKAQDVLIEESILKSSIEKLSNHKKTTFLFAEFPHLKEAITKFEGKYAEHNAQSLQNMLGDNWRKIVDELSSIGFIKRIPKTGTYQIPFIWRKGLDIRRGKNF